MRLAIFLLLTSFTVLGQEPTQPAHCEGLNCRVIKPGRAFEETEGEHDAIHFNVDRSPEQCYNALPLAGEMKDLPQFSGAKYFSPVGKEKKNFVLSITKDPEKHLEPGDILVYFRDVDKDSTQLYEHLTKGRWHAAIVGKREGKLFHLDSPPSMSGDGFKSSLYHIIRLRPDLPDREERMKRVLKNIDIMDAHFKADLSSVYDPIRKTEANVASTIPVIRSKFTAGECPPYRFYCSEVPLTVLVGAGLDPFKSESLLVGLERIEKNVLPRLLAKRLESLSKGDRATEDAERKKLVEESVTDLFRDLRMLRELGVADSDIKEFSETGKLPTSIQQTRDQLVMLLNTAPELRPLVFAASQFMEKDKGEVVGPSDLLDDIFNPKGVMSYVGSYVGDSCLKKPDQVATNSEATPPSLGVRPEMAVQLLRDPHHYFQYPLHQLSIDSLEVSPDGRFLVTGSQDQTAHIYDLRTRFNKELAHSGGVSSVKVSPDSRWAATASKGETIVASLREDKSRIFKGYDSMEFSKTGRYVLFSRPQKQEPPAAPVLGGDDKGSKKDYLLFDVERLSESDYQGVELKPGFNIAINSFSPDDKYLMSTGSIWTSDFGGAIYDAATGKIVKKFDGTKIPGWDMGGKYVLNTTLQNGVERFRLDDLNGKPETLELPGPTLLLPVGDGEHVVDLKRNDNQEIVVRSFSGKTLQLPVLDSGDSTPLPNVNEDRNLLAVPGDKAVTVLNLKTGKVVKGDKGLSFIEFINDDWLLGTDKERKVHLMNLQTGETKPTGLSDVQISQDRKRLLGSNGGNVEVRRIDSQEKVMEYPGGWSGARSSQFIDGTDLVVQPSGADIHILSSKVPTLSQLQKRMREYDASSYFGKKGEEEKIRKQIDMKFLLEKLKKGGLTKEDALREMNSLVTRATYRGFEPAPGEDTHIKGIIDEVFR